MAKHEVHALRLYQNRRSIEAVEKQDLELLIVVQRESVLWTVSASPESWFSALCDLTGRRRLVRAFPPPGCWGKGILSEAKFRFAFKSVLKGFVKFGGFRLKSEVC